MNSEFWKRESDADRRAFIAKVLEQNANQNKHAPAKAPTLVREPSNMPRPPRGRFPIPTPAPTVSIEAGPPPIVVSNIITVSDFFPIPIPPMDNFRIRKTYFTGHHWQEGLLVLDIICEGDVFSYSQNGRTSQMSVVNRFLVATFNPASKWWVVRVGDTPESRFYHRTTLLRGQLYTSSSGRIQKFDQTGMKWQSLGISEIGDCQLFGVNDRLYASDKNLILEILQDGKQTRVLASARRQPPVLALDAENLGSAFLFKGLGGSLSVCTSNHVWTWRNENWQKLCPMLPISLVPMDSGDHILFWSRGASVSRLNVESNSVELCFPVWRASPSPYASPFVRAQSSEEPPKALWNMPTNVLPKALTFAARKTDLYGLLNHSERKPIVSGDTVTSWEVLPKDGYQAALFRFRPNSPAATQLLLKFDGKGEPPLKNNDYFVGLWRMPSNWLCFTDTYLIFGSESFPSQAAGQIQDENSPTGIWLLPLDKIDAALGSLK